MGKLNMLHYETVSIDGTEVKDYGLTSGAAEYTDAIKTNHSTGTASLLVLCKGAADDVDLSFEVSLNGKAWHTPCDTAGNSLANIRTAVTSDQWIVFQPQMANYLRFKIDPDANSTITMYYIHQE